MRNGLKVYMSVYMKKAPYTEMLPDPYDVTNMRLEEYDDIRDIYLDARVFSDRDAARHHTGRHRDVIAKIVEHRKWGG